MVSDSENARRKALTAAAGQDAADAAQAAQARALAELPCAPKDLLALFDRVQMDVMDGCHHDWRGAQAHAKAHGLNWLRVQDWLQARSAQCTCDCAIATEVSPTWTPLLASAAGLPEPAFTAFPEPHTVFSGWTPEMASVFFPLLSIDLASLGWGQGCAHVVSVMGSGDPEVVWPASELSFSHAQFDWDGEHYRFAGDLNRLDGMRDRHQWHAEAAARYDARGWGAEVYEAMQAFKPGPGQAVQAWAAELQEQLAPVSFVAPTQGPAQSAEDWAAAMVAAAKAEADPRSGRAKARYVKALLNYWVTRDAYRATGRFIQGGAYLRQGDSGHERPFFERLQRTAQTKEGWLYVGSVCGWHYIESGENCLKLWVSPSEGAALLRMSWS